MRSDGTPVKGNFRPTMNVHTPNQQFDSQGLTSDGKLGWFEGQIKNIELREKGEGKNARMLQILQVLVTDTNVEKADGVPIQKGQVYTVWGDGNLLSQMGFDTKDDLEHLTPAVLKAWVGEHGNEDYQVVYLGGKEMDPKSIKKMGLKAGTKSHQYSFKLLPGATT